MSALHATLDGVELRWQLTLRGMTASDLARLAKVSPPTVSQALRGRPLSPHSVRAIVCALAGVDPLPGSAALVAAPNPP
jgi:transcriptional regulator with XRE-family HTH domain